jgi:hypothetical protein
MKTQVIFARMRADHSPGFFPFTLKHGELYPIDTTKTILNDRHEFNLLKRDIFGIASFSVPKNLCACVFKVVRSRFDVGQIVIKKGTEIAFRIYSMKWSDVDFWCQNGWGEANGFASGAYEDDLELASDEQIERSADYIKYYDELMEKKSKFSQSLSIESKVNN